MPFKLLAPVWIQMVTTFPNTLNKSILEITRPALGLVTTNTASQTSLPGFWSNHVNVCSHSLHSCICEWFILNAKTQENQATLSWNQSVKLVRKKKKNKKKRKTSTTEILQMLYERGGGFVTAATSETLENPDSSFFFFSVTGSCTVC